MLSMFMRLLPKTGCVRTLTWGGWKPSSAKLARPFPVFFCRAEQAVSGPRLCGFAPGVLPRLPEVFASGLFLLDEPLATRHGFMLNPDNPAPVVIKRALGRTTVVRCTVLSPK